MVSPAKQRPAISHFSLGRQYPRTVQEAQAKAQAKAQKQIANARSDEQAKAEENKLATAQKMVRDGVISVENAISYFGYSKEQILAK